MSIVENIERVGNFTSSQVYRLMATARDKASPGAPFFSYVEEKRYERKLGRSLDTDAYSRPMAWGELMEKRVFDLIGLEYKLISQETTHHPTIKGWSGSTDLVAPGIKISEVKGYQLKKFCAYQEVLKSRDIERLKKEFAQEYYQIISNAIIHQVPKGEAILYAPYESEMIDIKTLAENEDIDQWKYRFIYEGAPYELAVLPNDSGYDNLTVFEFEIPQEDADALTTRVKMAIELL
jgi:hypothetical protein